MLGLDYLARILFKNIKANISQVFEHQPAVRNHESRSKYGQMIQLPTIWVHESIFDQKIQFLKRSNPQSDQNPKNIQFHQKQI